MTEKEKEIEKLLESPGLTDGEKECINLLKKDSYTTSTEFNKLSKTDLTESVSYAAVITSPFNLGNIPKTSRSDRVVQTALKELGDLILVLDEDEKTPERQILALQNMDHGDGNVLEQFPKELLTEELCLTAVERCPVSLEYIPENLKTEQVCEKAFEGMLPYCDEDLCTLHSITDPDVIFKNLDSLGDNYDPLAVFMAINPAIMDKKIMDWGVEHDGNCIRYIPPEKRTGELIEKSFEINGLWGFMGTDILERNPEYIKRGIEQDRLSFNLIPRDLRKPEHYLLQDMLYPDFFECRPDLLPASIKNGNNIFMFNRELQQTLPGKLDFNEVMQLYNGIRVQKGDYIFSYNKEQQHLTQLTPKPQNERMKKEDEEQKKHRRMKR